MQAVVGGRVSKHVTGLGRSARRSRLRHRQHAEGDGFATLRTKRSPASRVTSALLQSSRGDEAGSFDQLQAPGSRTASASKGTTRSTRARPPPATISSRQKLAPTAPVGALLAPRRPRPPSTVAHKPFIPKNVLVPPCLLSRGNASIAQLGFMIPRSPKPVPIPVDWVGSSRKSLTSAHTVPQAGACKEQAPGWFQ